MKARRETDEEPRAPGKPEPLRLEGEHLGDLLDTKVGGRPPDSAADADNREFSHFVKSSAAMAFVEGVWATAESLSSSGKSRDASVAPTSSCGSGSIVAAGVQGQS